MHPWAMTTAVRVLVAGGDEVWHIRIAGDMATNRAGAGARGKAEGAVPRTRLHRIVTRLVDPPGHDRSWRRGAEGEETVGRLLDRLPPGWVVLHDLPLGTRGGNLDHLVIGPAGVFTINTKRWTGSVVVRPRALLRDGYRTDAYPKAVRESERVREALAGRGHDVAVKPLLVFVGTPMRVERQPDDVTVLRAPQLVAWLTRRPGSLRPADVAALERVARKPVTWGGPADEVLDRPVPRPMEVPVVPPQPPAPVETPSAPESVVVRRWTKFGHDRLYVNLGQRTLGYFDRRTGVVHVDVDADRERVLLALEGHPLAKPDGGAGEVTAAS